MRRALAPGLTLLVMILSWVFNPLYDFNRWDNFENFTPITIYAHQLWLSGLVPVINIQQNLGEAILGNAQSGVLYFPYTVGVLLLKVFGAESQQIQNLMSLFHFPLAAWGWFAFFGLWGVRRELAVVGALGLVAVGYFTLGSALWQHIGVEYAYFPWLLYWAKRIVDDPSPFKGTMFFGGIWFLAASGSHVQQLLYIGLHLLFFVLIYTWTRGQLSHWKRLVVPGLWVVAFALPNLSYSLGIRASSVRSGALPESIFFEASMTFKHLLGLLTPFAEVKDPLFSTRLTLFAFVGVWVLVGLWGAWRIREQRRLLLALLIPGILFLDFSLGANGLIYPFTKSIPVWSSFRWPFKFAIHFLAMFATLALIGLSQLDFKKEKLAVYGLWGLLGMSLLFGLPKEAWAWLLLAGQVLIVLGLTLGRAIGPWLLIGGATAAFAGSLNLGFDQPAHRYAETYGRFGSEYFQIKEPMRYRLATLALKPCEERHCTMQSYGTFHSAMVNDYLALTGHVMGLAPAALSDLLSGNAWGVLNPQFVSEMVGGPLLRSLGVRYYLLEARRQGEFQAAFAHLGLSAISQKDGWVIFADEGAPEVLSLPQRASPEPRDMSPRSVYQRQGLKEHWLEGLRLSQEYGPAKILDWQWLPGRGVQAKVENNSSGEVPLHASLYPYSFIEAFVGDRKVKLLRSNILGSGVMVPPGTHQVIIQASLAPLMISLGIAMAALAAGIWFLFKLQPKTNG